MNDQQERIQSTLRQIEKEKNVKVLYAVESGSRAVNMHGEQSDYDVRFIYVKLPVLEQYMSLFVDQKDTIEGFRGKDGDRQLDFNGWDLRKALILLGKSNIDILEWLQSPVVYKNISEVDTSLDNTDFHLDIISQMKQLANMYYSRKELCFSYLGMAKKRYHEATKTKELKKYLYVVRSILSIYYIDAQGHKGLPPMNIDALLSETLGRDDSKLTIQNIIVQLLEMKRQGKNSHIVISDQDQKELFTWIDESMQHCQTIAKQSANKKQTRGQAESLKDSTTDETSQSLDSNKQQLDDLFLHTIRAIHYKTSNSRGFL